MLSMDTPTSDRAETLVMKYTSELEEGQAYTSYQHTPLPVKKHKHWLSNKSDFREGQGHCSPKNVVSS